MICLVPPTGARALDARKDLSTRISSCGSTAHRIVRAFCGRRILNHDRTCRPTWKFPMVQRRARRHLHRGARVSASPSSQNFAEHDLNMQLDRGFRAVFGCWLHVFSASEFWISVHEKSGLLAAEFRKSTDRSISSSIS